MDLTVSPARRLAGRVQVGGDKSISHRAALIGALAHGDTVLHNFLRADDCLRTLRCLQALGVRIAEEADRVVVRGTGPRWSAPAATLDAGNSGTTMRLLAGILAGQAFTAEITGDASLRRRPMDRIVEPLTQMGARIVALGDGRFPPLRITGGSLRGIAYTLPVASAQVKSAVLLAGLLAEGTTTVREPTPTRDHTERMLAWFGVQVQRNGSAVSVTPGPLGGREVFVPGDVSSAAFVLAAAAARPDSDVTVEDVGLNPTRMGVLEVLQAMGADVQVRPRGERSGEPVGAVTVRGRPLRGVAIRGALIPRVIDELPVLCVVATAAAGVTIVADAAELRVKESDRIGAVAQGLRALGGDVEERPDGLAISGRPLQGGHVDSRGDHRVAMAFAVAGLLATAPVTVKGAESIAVSFPDFVRVLDAVRA
jgi:3-phosphoshikimate 1-carboxyvinyltransferase